LNTPSLTALAQKVDRLERAANGDAAEAPVDPARHDWYGEGCPCGLAPGDCREHPRARVAQRPPAGDWRVWMVKAGRGFGKTRTGAEWVRDRIERQGRRNVAIVGRTEKDARDICIEGPAGILAVSRPGAKPKYEPSLKRLTWPNGAVAHVYGADEPDSLRGPQHDDAWLDEVAAWKRRAAFDNLLLGLRLGDDPRAVVTTTPRSTPLIKELVADPATVQTGGSSFENERHLAPTFVANVLKPLENTRLGRQEVHAEILDLTEGAWFTGFDMARHVKPEAEYHPAFPVRLAIDCGTSATTGAVWFQVRQLDATRFRVTVFDDFMSTGQYSAKNAVAIKEHSVASKCGPRLDLVRVDPAARQHTGIGPAAYTEYAKVFGRLLERWPSHGVVDGLELMEMLLDTDCLWIHPRCHHLIDAFKNYARKCVHGVVLNYPADDQSPREDMMDALRGGIRDRFPEGLDAISQLRRVHAGAI
jgi:phage terminase large subunit-like protein